MKDYLIIISILLGIVLLMRVFKKQVRQSVYNLRARLRIRSLRTAIAKADKNKEETGRKNIVVFNTTNGVFEPVDKKVLKQVANVTKNKSNAKMTEGRRRIKAKNRKQKPQISHERVKQIERKALYVTE